MDRDFFKNLIVLMKKHKFWDTQPIMHSKKKLQKEGEIYPFKSSEQSDTPLPLPEGFEFDTFDVTDD